jgi:hypothetical protein
MVAPSAPDLVSRRKRFALVFLVTKGGEFRGE